MKTPQIKKDCFKHKDTIKIQNFQDLSFFIPKSKQINRNKAIFKSYIHSIIFKNIAIHSNSEFVPYFILFYLCCLSDLHLHVLHSFPFFYILTIGRDRVKISCFIVIHTVRDILHVVQLLLLHDDSQSPFI